MRSRPTLLPSCGKGVLLLAIVSLLGGCRGYYRSWQYLPNREVHDLTVKRPEKSPLTVRTEATIVGILRPDSAPYRKLHVRLRIENTSQEPLQLKPSRTRAVPNGITELAPLEAFESIELTSGEKRTVDMFFPLPDPVDLPNSSLAEIELRWVLESDGREYLSKATFRRGPRAYPGYGPNGYGPYDYGYGYPYRYYSYWPHYYYGHHYFHCY